MRMSSTFPNGTSKRNETHKFSTQLAILAKFDDAMHGPGHFDDSEIIDQKNLELQPPIVEMIEFHSVRRNNDISMSREKGQFN